MGILSKTQHIALDNGLLTHRRIETKYDTFRLIIGIGIGIGVGIGGVQKHLVL